MGAKQDGTEVTEPFHVMLKRLRCEARGFRRGPGKSDCVLTLEALGYESDISRVTLSHYEGGDRIPRRHQLRVIADVLNLRGKVRKDLFKAAGLEYLPPVVDLDPSLGRIYDLMNEVDEPTRRKIIAHTNRFAGRLEEAYRDL